ncbi:MAG TPA: SpoIIE family protein phosphatase [Verrucomicrobiae bacterium]|nr:SpoIIE family protein phosphatase [Verrucomicrobiae bacterium]
MGPGKDILDGVSEAEVTSGAASGSAVEGDRVKVLLIEDNPGDARLIEIMLEEEAGTLFEIEQVDRLARGLERLREGGYGMVLADLSLPDSQGLESFQQLHALAPELPIIVLSGLRDTTIALQAVHEGAQDFLIKGHVDGAMLVRAMRYAIERKRLTEQLNKYAEELRSKNAQLEADFNMAREIQQVFLPQQYPGIPSWLEPAQSALKFAHHYLPSAAVGGDFFDVFQVTDSSAGIIICDVMGHGMRAALITAVMRGLVEELVPVADDPGRFLAEVNRSLRAILKRTREPFLATAFYLVADAQSGELRYSSAGHPSPFRVQKRNRRVELLNSADPQHGPALGLFEKPVYPTCRAQAAPGDLIVLFTDGIYETLNSEGEEFGRKRLAQAVERYCGLSKERLLDKLVQEVRQFAGTTEFEDDVCLVAMEVERLATIAEKPDSSSSQ